MALSFLSFGIDDTDASVLAVHWVLLIGVAMEFAVHWLEDAFGIADTGDFTPVQISAGDPVAKCIATCLNLSNTVRRCLRLVIRAKVLGLDVRARRGTWSWRKPCIGVFWGDYPTTVSDADDDSFKSVASLDVVYE